ncbi:hypothetical protein [uncultured Pseudomonas sp.]|uniref:hypothetical protein n=1 Tax=uncultured Pseudomonas sp. TaxID=114707 RepID=UPI0025DF7CCE|nr:hypothetical protein [uncultured Pseudomonas sp.]
MKSTSALLTVSLLLMLFDPLAAQAWQVRGGGGARTFVVPHVGGGGYRPPMPAPHPVPAPRPMPPPPPPPHGDDWYHPWAAAAVVGATTATILAIGTRVTTVPVDCVSVVANGVAYQHCGPTWYQPQYVGSSVQYIVVAAPW